MKNTVHVLKKKIRLAVDNVDHLIKRLDGISHKISGSQYKVIRDQIASVKAFKDTVMKHVSAVLQPNKTPSERSLERLYNEIMKVETTCKGTFQRYVS